MSLAQLPAGTEFNGQYRVVRAIRAGGMGAVYECNEDGDGTTGTCSGNLTERDCVGD